MNWLIDRNVSFGAYTRMFRSSCVQRENIYSYLIGGLDQSTATSNIRLPLCHGGHENDVYCHLSCPSPWFCFPWFWEQYCLGPNEGRDCRWMCGTSNMSATWCQILLGWRRAIEAAMGRLGRFLWCTFYPGNCDELWSLHIPGQGSVWSYACRWWTNDALIWHPITTGAQGGRTWWWTWGRKRRLRDPLVRT